MNRLITKISLFALCVLAGRTLAAENRQDILLDEGWRIRPADNVEEAWYPAMVPSTVMGTLTANGLYGDIFVGDNYGRTDRTPFSSPWIYEKEFEIGALAENENAFLEFDGISYRADVWLNGQKVAGCEEMKGPFRQFRYDVTSILADRNVLTVKLYPARKGEFNIGFVDWNPRPYDESMGIFRPVRLTFSGQVSVLSPAVRTKVDTASLKRAWLTVESTLSNNSDAPVEGVLQIRLSGKKYEKKIALSSGETRLVRIEPSEAAMLDVRNPKLWWCHNLGEPNMQSLRVRFIVNGKVSDEKEVSFGIRQIDSYFTPEGHRGFILNGRKVLIKGAGWTDDIFLRNDDRRNATELSYVKDMNLNAVRFENIWGTSQNIYDQCDRLGLLALVGWSCFWEWEGYSGVPNDEFGCIKSEEDMTLIAQSFRDQVLWLRNHPSIIAWYVGSDMLPRPELEKKYLAILPQIDDRPYVSSAKALVSEVSGPAGMKMVGPYDYQAPSYWYSPEAPGGSIGFNTETGIGAQLPVIESLEKMIPEDQLWPVDAAYDYHCTTAGEAMHSLDVLKEVMSERYGDAGSLEDFLHKAHHLDYDGTRAMFEGFRVNLPRTTGIIQWMLNSAWPSLYWQLYDWYLAPTAGYYSVKKACAPRQLVYNYVDKNVYAVNDERAGFSGEAQMELYSLSGELLHRGSVKFSASEGESVKLSEVPVVDGMSFLFLTLKDARGRQVETNWYALSSKEDITDWSRYNWIRTPLSQCADYTSLAQLPEVEVKASLKKVVSGQYEVTLTNQADAVAFFIRLSLKNSEGETVVPAYWDENFISLKPGETRRIRCTIPELAAPLTLALDGWNVR